PSIASCFHGESKSREQKARAYKGSLAQICTNGRDPGACDHSGQTATWREYRLCRAGHGQFWINRSQTSCPTRRLAQRQGARGRGWRVLSRRARARLSKRRGGNRRAQFRTCHDGAAARDGKAWALSRKRSILPKTEGREGGTRRSPC